MDVREKLVELLDEAEEWADHKCDELDCETCPADKMKGNCVQQLMVDRLIAHGVTVQRWISVKDRLPENDYGKHWKDRKYYIVRYAPSGLMCVAHYGYKEYDWWIDNHDCVMSATNFKEVTHWMLLPQPPKGE